ncbi:MAG: 3-oxoacyl-[acyl-carrier-protein] synthase III C-terminal domain-containing protein [Archangium sp.]
MNSHEELVFRRGGGALRHAHQGRASDADLAFIVNGPLVARSYPRLMSECVSRVLDGASLAPRDISRFYFHQPNKRVMDLFTSELQLERDRVAMNVDRYGNTSAAGMLVLLSEDLNDGRVAFGRGEPVVFAAVGANVHGGGQVVIL